MMPRTLVLSLIVTAIALGCARTQPIYNVNAARIAGPPGVKLSMQDVATAIWMAGKKKGWEIAQVRPGEMTGTLRLRSHLAVVSIVHDTSAFSIAFQRGENVLHSGWMIHRNYNNWIRGLEHQIQTEIAGLASGR